MWEALRVAAADEFVRAHDDGLQMRVAQGGINFSGGQRQRLAIARAVIRRPAIYLFDDAFSALDVHTDARVRASLREISGDCHGHRCHTTYFDRGAGRPGDRRRQRADWSARAHTNRCWPTAPPTRSSPTRRSRGGRGRAVTAPTRRPGRRRPPPAAMRSRDFWGSATRLVKRLAPQRRLAIAVITLGITGTAIGVVVPRILGHATDLLFNGVIGRRLPAGITKAQAVAAGPGPRRQRLRRPAVGDERGAGPRCGLRRGAANAGAGVDACIWLPRC